jgi:hypothetical protein
MAAPRGASPTTGSGHLPRQDRNALVLILALVVWGRRRDVRWRGGMKLTDEGARVRLSSFEIK